MVFLCFFLFLFALVILLFYCLASAYFLPLFLQLYVNWLLMLGLQLTADCQLDNSFLTEVWKNWGGPNSLIIYDHRSNRSAKPITRTNTFALLKASLKSKHKPRPCYWWARPRCPCTSSQVSNHFAVHETQLLAYAYVMPHYYIILV